MTATASNSGMFQNVMDWFNTTSGNAQGMAGRATEGFRQGVGIQGVTTPGRAASAGQGLGQLTKGSLNPLVLSLAGLPNFAQGDVVGGIAASGGSILGGLGIKPFLPALAAIPVAGPALAVTGAIAAPYIAGKAAEGVTKMFAGPVQAATQATTTAGGNVINNQLNPNAPVNVADSAVNNQMQTFKAIKDSLGEQAAIQYAQQGGMVDKLREVGGDRFNLAMRRAPVAFAANAGLKGLDNAASLMATGLNTTGTIANSIVSGRNEYLIG